MSDATKVMAGTFTATGQSPALNINGPFNVSVSGFGVGTVALQRSFDNGTNWVTVESYETDAEKVADEPEAGVQYRFNCSTYTSGTLAYRISQ